MTQTEADEIVRTSTRCTQATLRAFGIEGYPLHGSGTLDFFTSNGFTLREIKFEKPITMEKFQRTCMKFKSNYHIKTKNHAMAVVDGILIDTERRGFDNRKILFCWIVEPSARKETLSV